MSTSSLLRFNIDNDLVNGNTHFVEEGATFNWEISLMSNVSLYNGTGTSSFKTITFTTNSNKTQVLLGFNVLDRNGNVLSQIGANGRLRILEIYDANYGTNNRLRQYDGKKVQLTDTRYARFVESGVPTDLNRFQLSIIPTDDLILEPVVSDVGYSVYYECTAVTCDYYTLDYGYRSYTQTHYYDYSNRLTCMNYSIESVNINWSTTYFSIIGYYDNGNYISSYCPDINSDTLTYTLDHDYHNATGGEVSDSTYYKYDNSCERWSKHWCSYCDRKTDLYKDITHSGNYSTDTSWSTDNNKHWHNIRCQRCKEALWKADESSHNVPKNASLAKATETHHYCTVCNYEQEHSWDEGTAKKDCTKDKKWTEYHCKVCNKAKDADVVNGDCHDWTKNYSSWAEGTRYCREYKGSKVGMHYAYKYCTTCNPNKVMGIGMAFDIIEQEGGCTYSGAEWKSATDGNTGYDVIRYCTKYCLSYEGHNHSQSCRQTYGTNLGGTKTLKNADYCIDSTGLVCKYDLKVVAYKNKCKVTGKDLNIITGTATFYNKTSHQGDDNAFQAAVKRAANAFGNIVGKTADEKFPSTCTKCQCKVLRPYTLKVEVNGEVKVIKNNSWILQSSLAKIDNNNNGIWLSIFVINIGGYTIILS